MYSKPIKIYIGINNPIKILCLNDDQKALILDKNIKHSNNPVLTWMASNLQAKVDVKGNVYPRKAKDENKIDGILALLVAMARARLQAQPSAPIMFFA